MRVTNILPKEAVKTPNFINSKKTMLKHIIIKLLKIKDKEKNLKSSQRQKKYYYRGTVEKTERKIKSKLFFWWITASQNIQPPFIKPPATDKLNILNHGIETWSS